MKSTLYCITNAFIMLGDMKPSNAIVIASALFVNIVLSANASVASKIIIGNCVSISIPTYVNIFNISNWLVLKLYSNTGTDRLSNPNTMPPTINSINRIITIANTVIINIVIYFDNKIFALLYGFINNNLTVPLLNSSLTIVPAIITIITIINNPYSEKRFNETDILYLDRNRLFQTRTGTYNNTRFDRLMSDFNFQYIKNTDNIEDLNIELNNKVKKDKIENAFLENAIKKFQTISGYHVWLDFIDNYRLFKNSSFVLKENNNS